MFIEIVRLYAMTIETLPVAYGRGFVVFNPVMSNPTHDRDSVGSRRAALLEHERYLRLDRRERTQRDRRPVRTRETVRGSTL